MNGIKKAIWNIGVNKIGASSILPGKVRNFIYRFCGMNIKNAGVRSGCFFKGKNIEIGEGAFINHNTFIDCDGKVIIGNNVFIAFETMIVTSTHDKGTSEKRAGKTQRQPVTIGDGSWIGARVTILPGVTIGEGCIIASGSVVIGDCKPNSLYAGVPAEWKKDLPVGDKISEVV